MHPIISEDIDQIVNRLGDQAAIFAGKRVMISGGLGFLGQSFRSVFHCLNERVLDTPCSLIVLDNKITNHVEYEADKYEEESFLEQDICHPIDPGGQIDFIIHCAGIASPYYYRKWPIETIEVATLGTKNVLELAHEMNAKMLFFSSSEIYGDPDSANVPTRETYKGNVACLGPRACYDESKRLGETMCHIYANYKDTKVSIVRPFNVYGPGMRENDYRVLPNFASAIKTGQSLAVYGDGSQTRTYCYISDAIVGFMLALIKGGAGEAYNIGNPDPELSVLSLVETIESIIGRKVEKELMDYPETYPGDEPSRRCPDISKAKDQLGYSPEISVEEGLKRYLDWADEVYTGDRNL